MFGLIFVHGETIQYRLKYKMLGGYQGNASLVTNLKIRLYFLKKRHLNLPGTESVLYFPSSCELCQGCCGGYSDGGGMPVILWGT